jgi:hypothetical protein
LLQVLPLAARRPRLWLAAPLALLLGCGLAASVSALLPIAVAAHADSEPQAEALAANAMWWGALATGRQASVAAMLAPEFQSVRTDGVAYDRSDYLAAGLPRVAAVPDFRGMTATRNGDLLVTRYTATVRAAGNGADVSETPRLTVFRHQGGAWLVVADADLAPRGR